jgi:hypothetical protein
LAQNSKYWFVYKEDALRLLYWRRPSRSGVGRQLVRGLTVVLLNSCLGMCWWFWNCCASFFTKQMSFKGKLHCKRHKRFFEQTKRNFR